MPAIPPDSTHLVSIDKMLELVQKICAERGIGLVRASFEAGLGRTFYSKLIYRHSRSINSDSFVSVMMWLLQYGDPSVSIQELWDEVTIEREE